jgi:hypothetical protein
MVLQSCYMLNRCFGRRWSSASKPLTPEFIIVTIETLGHGA